LSSFSPDLGWMLFMPFLVYSIHAWRMGAVEIYCTGIGDRLFTFRIMYIW